jgi:hypothetical protein
MVQCPAVKIRRYEYFLLAGNHFSSRVLVINPWDKRSIHCRNYHQFTITKMIWGFRLSYEVCFEGGVWKESGWHAVPTLNMGYIRDGDAIDNLSMADLQPYY